MRGAPWPRPACPAPPVAAQEAPLYAPPQKPRGDGGGGGSPSPPPGPPSPRLGGCRPGGSWRHNRTLPLQNLPVVHTIAVLRIAKPARAREAVTSARGAVHLRGGRGCVRSGASAATAFGLAATKRAATDAFPSLDPNLESVQPVDMRRRGPPVLSRRASAGKKRSKSASTVRAAPSSIVTSDVSRPSARRGRVKART